MKRVSLSRQRGVTMVVVLLLMTVMLLGGLALARITESSILVSGNVAVKEASVQASEVGLNTAQAALIALANEITETGNDGGCEPNVSFNYTFDGSKLTLTYVGDPEADKECQGRYADFNNVTYTLVEE